MAYLHYAGMLTPVASVDNNGEAVPLAVDLSRPVTLIGRGPQLPAHGVHMYCKAGVEQKTVNAVSRNHATITRVSPTEWRLDDLGSVNGSFVNFVKVLTSPLRNGDILHFGGGHSVSVGQRARRPASDFVYKFITYSGPDMPAVTTKLVLPPGDSSVVVGVGTVAASGAADSALPAAPAPPAPPPVPAPVPAPAPVAAPAPVEAASRPALLPTPTTPAAPPLLPTPKAAAAAPLLPTPSPPSDQVQVVPPTLVPASAPSPAPASTPAPAPLILKITASAVAAAKASPLPSMSSPAPAPAPASSPVTSAAPSSQEKASASGVKAALRPEGTTAEAGGKKSAPPSEGKAASKPQEKQAAPEAERSGKKAAPAPVEAEKSVPVTPAAAVQETRKRNRTPQPSGKEAVDAPAAPHTPPSSPPHTPDDVPTQAPPALTAAPAPAPASFSVPVPTHKPISKGHGALQVADVTVTGSPAPAPPPPPPASALPSALPPSASPASAPAPPPPSAPAVPSAPPASSAARARVPAAAPAPFSRRAPVLPGGTSSTACQTDLRLPAGNQPLAGHLPIVTFLLPELSCTLCRGLLVKPVTLACSHGFCLSCIVQHLQSSPQCPVCHHAVVSSVPPTATQLRAALHPCCHLEGVMDVCLSALPADHGKVVARAGHVASHAAALSRLGLSPSFLDEPAGAEERVAKRRRSSDQAVPQGGESDASVPRPRSRAEEDST